MLAAYERSHGTIYVNQGRRTIAEQAAFYAHYLRYGRPLAAKPFLGAPHIKYGKEHHALDINDGVVDGVANFYRSQDVPVAFNVPGEPWHMDTLDEAALKRAAARLGGAEKTLKRGSKGPSVVRLKKLLYDKGYRDFGSRYNPLFNAATQAAVKRLQRKHDLRGDGIVGAQTWRLLKK